jgi:hypothetical protein
MQDPKQLLELWNEYKDNVGYDLIQQATPKGDVVELKVRKPFTRQGFEAFAFNKLGYGINHYIDNYRNKYAEFVPIVTHIRNEWQNDQISGTLTGKYKAPNLVARINAIGDNVNASATFKVLNIDPLDDTSDNSTKEDITAKETDTDS